MPGGGGHQPAAPVAVQLEHLEALGQSRESDGVVQRGAAALSTEVLTTQSRAWRWCIHCSDASVRARPWPWRCSLGATERRWR